jgi:prolyl-tRNA synthetase
LDIEPAFALVHQTPYAPCQPEAEYQDEQGQDQSLWMANWDIDLGRLLAAIVEQHHDDYGPIWPSACTPFDIHLVALDLRKEAVADHAETLYRQLVEQGFSVLYDDRDGSAGVKFNDADLGGIPLRLTISKRSVKEGVVEAKWRNSRDRMKLDDEGLMELLSHTGSAPA